jgi:hypothetical protein
MTRYNRLCAAHIKARLHNGVLYSVSLAKHFGIDVLFFLFVVASLLKRSRQLKGGKGKTNSVFLVFSICYRNFISLAGYFWPLNFID